MQTFLKQNIMKKINLLKLVAMAVAVAVLFVAIPETASAQMSKKMEKTLQKQQDKQYKTRMKELKKEGWKLAGGSRTLEVALLEHYQKKYADEKNKEFIGDMSTCRSINACRQGALNNAQNRYAALASSNVKGRIGSLLRADANRPETEIDKMIAAYEKEVQADISGALTESYSIIKDNADGTKSFQTVFIVNEEEAASARARAMERSLKETKVTLEEADEISKFVREGFSVE
jgi:superfamily II DNA or RNA helicase